MPSPEFSPAPYEVLGSPDTLEPAAERAKKNLGFRKVAGKIAYTAIPIVLAAIAVIASNANAANTASQKQAPQPEGTEETGSPASQDQKAYIDDGEQTPVNLDEELSHSETPWINDGYGEKGMYKSEGKSWEYNFANASEVAEVCQNDVRDMIIYTAENQSESFADYLAGLPEKLQPEGFKGLSLSETEDALENLSQKEYEAVMSHFEMVMNSASTRFITIDGEFDNAFMSRRNPDGPFTHENMQLVQSPTYENHLMVTEFCWFDENGNEIGSMIAKITPVFDEQGIVVGFEGCEQIVTKRGTRPHIYDVPPAPAPAPSPENPNPDPEKPQHDPKDPEAIERNMQTGGETSNYVNPLDAGTSPSPRPVTGDSFSDTSDDGTSNSASRTGQIIGEIIANADQTYASHENRNPNLDTGEPAIIDQNNANETAEAMKPKAQDLETITDEEAADWFNTLTQGGGGN